MLDFTILLQRCAPSTPKKDAFKISSFEAKKRLSSIRVCTEIHTCEDRNVFVDSAHNYQVMTRLASNLQIEVA